MKAFLRETRNRMRSFLSNHRHDRELDEELASHIDMAVEENLRSGMAPEEARRQALIRFGGVQQARERQREARGLPWLDVLLQDLRYSFRTLRRSPTFALVAILTLALGIGVNTAIFSVANGLLFRSIGLKDTGRLDVLALQQKGGAWQDTVSLPEYRDLREQTGNDFSNLAAEQVGLDGISSQGSKPERAFTDYVSGNYFQTLGVRPFMGRFFLPNEGETPGADPVMVLSYSLWKRHFAGDPHVIGRRVFVDGQPITIIGVTPKEFHGVYSLLAVGAYLPLSMMAPIENVPMNDWNKRSNRNLNVYGHLRSGITAQQAQATLATVALRFAVEHPSDEKDVGLRSFPIYFARNGFDPQNTIAVISALFLGLAGLVLLLACMNVANLLLVRATVREREMVIRSALGAQRSRLMRQMLTESILLAIFGGAAGMGLGIWGSSLLGSLNLHTDVPLYLNFGFDWNVLAFSAALALFAGAIVGMVPAVRLSRVNLNRILHEGGRGVTKGGSKFRDALVILQVGSALLLLIIAGLFTRSLRQAGHVNLGFNPSHVLTLATDPSEIGYKDSQTRDFYRDLLARVGALPGIDSATTASEVPLSEVDSGGFDTLSINGYQPPPGQSAPSAGYSLIAGDYFRTLRIPMLEGRTFSEGDDEKSLYVAIVSQTMAKKFWPNQNPIGRTFRMASDPAHTIQVVGVARDARYQGITGQMGPMFYIPFLQHYRQNSLQFLELRTTGDPAAMIPVVERAVHNLTPALPVFEVKTLRQGLYSPNGLLPFEVAAALAGIMGMLGLILAVIGVYGVLSYVVSQKTSEIGIRMALGAKRADILKMVYRQGLWIVGIGLTFGLAATLAAAHLLRSFFIVSATDPATYIGVSAILVAIALVACYVPAYRAMHVEPMQALRAE